MQTVGHLVEFHEPCRHTTRDTAVRCDRVDLVHRRLQQVFERYEVLRRAPLGDVVDLGLRAVHNVGHVGAVRAGVPVLHDPRSGLHKPSQQGLLRDDARVEPGVGGGRHRRDQRVQIRRSTDTPQQAAAIQFGGHRHRIGRFPAAVQVQDRVVDVLVRGPVEVARAQPLQHVGDGVLAQQHAAENRLFGGGVLRRLAAEVLGGWRDVHARMAKVIHNSHGTSTSPNPVSNVGSIPDYRDCKSDLRQPPRSGRRN